MAYTPDWEPLADALKRVMATGSSEDEAKTDLCRAMADRKIGVRVQDRCKRSRNARPGLLSRECRGAAAPRSRRPRLGAIEAVKAVVYRTDARAAYSWIGGWEERRIDFIELSTADVAEIFPSPEGATKESATIAKETAAAKALASHLERNPDLKRADAANWCREHGHQLGKRAFDRVLAASAINDGVGANR